MGQASSSYTPTASAIVELLNQILFSQQNMIIMGINLFSTGKASSLSNFIYENIWLMCSKILQGGKVLKLWLWLWQIESCISVGLGLS